MLSAPSSDPVSSDYLLSEIDKMLQENIKRLEDAFECQLQNQFKCFQDSFQKKFVDGKKDSADEKAHTMKPQESPSGTETETAQELGRSLLDLDLSGDRDVSIQTFDSSNHDVSIHSWAVGRKKLDRMQSFLDSPRFSLWLITFILANSFVIGSIANIECQYYMDAGNQGEPSGLWWDSLFVLERIFTVILTLEILVRLSVHGTSSFSFRGEIWTPLLNFAAPVFCLTAILENFGNIGVNLTFVRMFRLFPIVYMLKFLQNQPRFDSLKRMVYSVMNSVLSLVWVIFITTGFTFVFALYICLVVSQYLKEKRSEPNWEAEIEKFEMFSNIWRAMLTVFQSFTGGMDWELVTNPLISISAIHGFVYCMFFVVIVFGMMNVVTGLFVEAACTIAKTDRTALIDCAMEEEKLFKAEMENAFNAWDVDGSHSLARDEFENFLSDGRVCAFLSAMGMPVNDGEQLFNLLDENGDGQLTLEEFVNGSAKVRASSMNIYVMDLKQHLKKIEEKLDNLYLY